MRMVKTHTQTPRRPLKAFPAEWDQTRGCAAGSCIGFLHFRLLRNALRAVLLHKAKRVDSGIGQHPESLPSWLMRSERRPSFQQVGFGLIDVVDCDVEMQASWSLWIRPR